MRSIYFPAVNKPPTTNLSRSEIQAALANQDGLLWVSLEQPGDEEILDILGNIFHFHPLAIEDCQSVGPQPPKVDDFGDYIFIIAGAIHPNHSLDELQTVELNLFLGQNYLVTSCRDKSLHAVDMVWRKLERDERLRLNGSDFLCHAVLDVLVDDYMPYLDQMDEEIEWLEDRVISQPDPETLQRILLLKHSVMSLRRIISPLREVVNRLSRDEFKMIDQQSRIYFRDIYDHLVRIQDLSESIRDIVSGAQDIYLNSTSLRLNEIMKALTIVSTIFLPMSFIAGVYGMNFQYFPEIRWKLGYLFVWIIFLSIPAGMLLYFKKRKWF